MRARERSRRTFLLDSAAGLSGAWVAANYAGILDAEEYVVQAAQTGQLQKLTFFSAEQAIEVEAVAARIIPTDQTAGAREARCLNFIDRALSTFARGSQLVYVKGLQELQAQTSQLFPNTPRFSGLSAPQQIQVLTEMEGSAFFNAIRTHTVIGFFASPVHGGNQDKVGWQLIGYDDSLNHRPPFGYYDAQPQPRR